MIALFVFAIVWLLLAGYAGWAEANAVVDETADKLRKWEIDVESTPNYLPRDGWLTFFFLGPIVVVGALFFFRETAYEAEPWVTHRILTRRSYGEIK